jgi:hypothetical protein
MMIGSGTSTSPSVPPMNRRRSQGRWRLAAAVAASVAASGPGSAPLAATEAVPPAAERPDNANAGAPALESAQRGSTWGGSGQFVVVGGVLDSGTMPGDPAAGIEAAAAQSWSATRWRLHVIAGATFFPQQDMGNPMFAGVPSGRYWMVSFSGRGCLTAVLSRFEVGPCLGGEVAVMHASKLVGLPSTDSTQSWFSPVGSAVAGVAVASRVVLFARAEIVVPTTRRSFLSNPIVGYYDVYKVPAFAFRAAVGVELRIF